jgi:hypothetical protein
LASLLVMGIGIGFLLRFSIRVLFSIDLVLIVWGLLSFINSFLVFWWHLTINSECLQVDCSKWFDLMIILILIAFHLNKHYEMFKLY